MSEGFIPVPPEEQEAIINYRPMSRTGLSGTAGEYYVAAELSRRGWLATMTIKNAPGIDVLAQHADTGHLITVQAKTSAGSGDFVLRKRCETPTKQTNAWYALVGLRGLDERPDFWLMPRNHVAALVYVSHQRWLQASSKGGKPHKDNPMRGLTRSEIDSYREDWDALLQPTTKRKHAMPEWFAEWVLTFPLRADHPDAKRFAGVTPNSRRAQQTQ